MNYTETTDYLFTSMPSFQNVGGSAYKPGLERMMALCEALGHPERQYPVIHIAGTNGKGSTSHILASLLQSAGYRVGLFTSPHLRDFRERMRINAEMIGEREVVEFVAKNRAVMEQLQLSFFEMSAGMAFDHFARGGVEIAIIETGLGGRLDATNVVHPLLSIITNIGIDHTQYLGDTIAKIAAEKAGIIKRGATTIIGEACAESADVFEAKGREVAAPIIYAQERCELARSQQLADHQRITLRDKHTRNERAFTLDLMGEYQYKNLIAAITAIDYINANSSFTIGDKAIEDGLAKVMEQTGLRGRWQRLSTAPLVVCDTGHNIHGVKEVARQLAHQKYSTLYCVLGFARDKDIRAMLSLFPREAHYILTSPHVDRAADTATLLSIATEMGLSCEVVEGVSRALDHALEIAQHDDMIFVGGSNFVVAEIDLQ